MPIMTPLPNIPVHVVQSPGIAGKTAYRHGLFPVHALLAPTVDEVTVVIGLLGRDRFAKVIRRGRSRTAGVFPFRLCRQSIRPLLFFPELLAEVPAILPRHLL